MTAARWDDLPDNWRAAGVKSSSDGSNYPSFLGLLQAAAMWRHLTRVQREVLLSSVAGYPIACRADVLKRMVARGLVDKYLNPTEAGKFIVRWKLP